MRIEDFAGMKWDEVVAFMHDKRHLLAFSGDDEVEIARLAHNGEFGSKCAAAVVVARLLLKKNGARRTLSEAFRIYDEVSPGSEFINEMRYDAAWAGIQEGECLWPIEFVGNSGEKAGLANIMMMIAILELFSGSTADQVAASLMYSSIMEKMNGNRENHEQEQTTERTC